MGFPTRTKLLSIMCAMLHVLQSYGADESSLPRNRVNPSGVGHSIGSQFPDPGLGNNNKNDGRNGHHQQVPSRKHVDLVQKLYRHNFVNNTKRLETLSCNWKQSYLPFPSDRGTLPIIQFDMSGSGFIYEVMKELRWE